MLKSQKYTRRVFSFNNIIRSYQTINLGRFKNTETSRYREKGLGFNYAHFSSHLAIKNIYGFTINKYLLNSKIRFQRDIDFKNRVHDTSVEVLKNT